MTKDELAVAATFLVAELRIALAGSEQGKIYADYASMCLPLKDVKLNNRADQVQALPIKAKTRLEPFFAPH